MSRIILHLVVEGGTQCIRQKLMLKVGEKSKSALVRQITELLELIRLYGSGAVAQALIKAQTAGASVRMGQAPGDDVVDRIADLIPTGVEGFGGFGPRQPPRSARQEDHVRLVS